MPKRASGEAGGFRPRVAPTLITLAMVLVCLGLGVWQVQRLHWKEGLIARRDAALTAPPVTAPETAAKARLLEFHRVTAEGVLLNGREIALHSIGPSGGAGFDILTPLREGDGRIVFVDRGFVPNEMRKGADRLPGPDGVVQVTGRLRLPPAAKPGWFVPQNEPQRGEWFWIDLPALARAAGLPADGLHNIAPFYIDADAEASPSPDPWPKPHGALPELPNHHLQYAITWFSLAAAATVIYVLSQRRDGGRR